MNQTTFKKKMTGAALVVVAGAAAGAVATVDEASPLAAVFFGCAGAAADFVSRESVR